MNCLRLVTLHLVSNKEKTSSEWIMTKNAVKSIYFSKAKWVSPVFCDSLSLLNGFSKSVM
jgi:hypothetical protein